MKKIIAISLTALIVVVGVFIFSTKVINQKKERDSLYSINRHKKLAQKVLYDVWNHYKNNENFTGDWWAGKFPHPKMILEDGRPLAFPDGLDVDMDGIADIDWGNPKKPFEYVVVSESASYDMLRAVWMRDKKTFDKIWKWTHDNLQRANIDKVYYWKDVNSPENGWKTVDEMKLARDNLFAWRWIPTIADYDGDGKDDDGVIYYRWQKPTEDHDPNVPWRDGWDIATDADCDIALSLIFADSLWGSSKDDSPLNYADHAKGILDDLWDKTTYVIDGYRYLAGGDNIKSVEPGYLSPFSFRIYSDFDPEHDWMQLVDSSYRIFRDAVKLPMNPIKDNEGIVHSNDPTGKKPAPNLLPDWVNVGAGGKLEDGNPRNEPEFGTDAFRALWRIAVDYMWFGAKEAEEVLWGNSGTIDFLKWRMEHPPKEFDGKDKMYDLNGKLSSVFWHNGDVALFEPNYEPAETDPEKRKQMSTGYRANCAQYGVYLSYLYAGKEYETAEKLLMPMITEDIDGFSRREYIIPEDQLKWETPENIAKNTPKEERDPSDDKGTPYDENDGWYCKTKWGGYWTQYDQSDWNSQSEYFNNTWAWFGLATYAGIVQNLYVNKQREPKNIDYLKVYKDRTLLKEQTGPITQEYVYVAVKGKDANRRVRNYIKVNVSSTDHNKENHAIQLKLSETSENSGLYVGKLRLGMNSETALSQIGASLGSSIVVEVVGNKKFTQTKEVGRVYISEVIEDFANGAIDDANPTAWWTDSINTYSKEDTSVKAKESGYYIWRDGNDTWYVVMKAHDGMHTFQGTIYSDGDITDFKQKNIESNDKVLKSQKTFSFSTVEKNGIDIVSFKSKGETLYFEVKFDGVFDNQYIYIGKNLVDAYGVPFKLSNVKKTGTYELELGRKKTIVGSYSLKIKKKYSGNDFPYLGSVLFNSNVMDWSNTEEFSMWVYLKEDIGNIRVDIQDKNGNSGILNSYNPWDPSKGEGWYVWKSNVARGTEINRDNVDPRSIKDRRFWKGWVEKLQQTVDITDNFDLSNIVNVLMSIAPGEDRDVELIIDRLALQTSNFNRGTSEPRNISSIYIYKDPLFRERYAKGELIKQDKVYVELIGKDGSPYTVDTIMIDVHSSDRHPSCGDIRIPLEEKSVKSGIYRGELRVGIASNERLGIIGAGRGSSIKLSSDVNRLKTSKIKVGEFHIVTPVEDFETDVAGKRPSSWWTDELDPVKGVPEYAAGRVLNYYIWKSDDGVWHLRWSADLKPHTFSGSIISDKGIALVKKINVNENDGNYVRAKKSGSISFKADEQYGDGGFDFKVAGTDVKFDIKIDGIHYGNKVQVGKHSYKKTYSIPFILKNHQITKTYEILTNRQKVYEGETSLFIKKTYSKRDYPYFGKWGLAGEKADFSLQDSLKFMVYLPQDVGSIRVDLEDNKQNGVILNEYNPWDEKKGAGWYEWDSNFVLGTAVSEKKAQPLAIKDRLWWKGWDVVKQQNVDRTKKIDLKNIVNVLFSIGGGDKGDVKLNLDNIRLYRANYHMGETKPKKVRSINLYTSPTYTMEKLNKRQIVTQKTLYVEVKGDDGNNFERDRFYILIDSTDKSDNCQPIRVRVYETEVNSGIYRGKFSIDLASNETHEVIGAARDSIVTVRSPQKDIVFPVKVGDMDNSYAIDDFEDGSISDKNPLTWWIDTIDPIAKKIDIDPVYDKGVFIYKDINDSWHLLWNPENKEETLKGVIGFQKDVNIISKKQFKDGFELDKQNKKIIIDAQSIDKGPYELVFKVSGEKIKTDFRISGQLANNKIFIGNERKNPYILPIELSNKPVAVNYELNISNEKAKFGKYSMKVNKKYVGNDYPYFGGWGLTGDISDFRDKEVLSFWVYLKSDPGNIRVDVEDGDGTIVVLNGYNPYDYSKGEGWYLWTSNFAGGVDVDEGNVQPLPIKDRQWWRGWDGDKQKYVDKTDEFNLAYIKNIQFSIGGGDKRDIELYIDNISVTKPNYHFGSTKPASVRSIKFYKDKHFSNEYGRGEIVGQEKVYMRITGTDGNSLSLDRFEVVINTNDNRDDSFPIKVYATETDINSGVYTGLFSLGLRSNERFDVIGVEKGRTIIVKEGGRSAKLNIGEVKGAYIVEDFADSSITDKNPVTWWTDSVDPFSPVPILNKASIPGYYIWKDRDLWHIRFKASRHSEKFEGSIRINGKFQSVKFVDFKLLDKKAKTGNTITFSSKIKDHVVGIDFVADSDYIDFDIKQNDVYQGRKIFIGESNALAYSVPLRLDNNKISRTYTMSVVKSNRTPNGYMMKVDKKYNDKDYPYFGCWGLRGETSQWDEIDEFYMWIYLEGDAGIIKVELEDKNGIKGILNGYNPYDPKKGPGWYKWTSNKFDSVEVKDDNVDALPIKNRRWWKAWDDNEQAFADTTDRFDLHNVKNIQFIIGGGEKKDAVVYFDNLVLEKTNYRMGDTYPTLIERIHVYKSKTYSEKYKRSALINKSDIFIEIMGKDGNSEAVDMIEVLAATSDENQMYVSLTETSADSGVYRGQLSLQRDSEQLVDKALKVGINDVLTIKTLGSDLKVYSMVVGEKLKDKPSSAGFGSGSKLIYGLIVALIGIIGVLFYIVRRKFDA